MASKKILSGMTVATAAAGLFLSGCAATGGSMEMKTAEVHCSGINACKGQSSCKSAMNDCKGKNSCKGKGWLPKISESTCEEDGGKVI